MESRERAAPRDLRVQVHQPQENGFMSVDGEAHPVVNLGRADQAQASQARVEVHQVMTIHGVPMMVHGQIVHTMDVSSFFVYVNIYPAVDLVVCCCCCCRCCCLLLGSVHHCSGYLPRLFICAELTGV